MPTNNNHKKTVLITGASTGFGREIAELLARQNYTVFGTTRNPNPTQPANYKLLTLDVQSAESIQSCINQILQDSATIDILINNAGVTLDGPAEETSIDQARHLFETNFFGLLQTTNAVLPIMRKQRQGQIINIASLAGLLGVPGHSLYSATKHAVEGYTEALAGELHRFKIKVSIVEPGFFRTNLKTNAPQASLQIADYDKIRQKLTDHFQNGVDQGGHPVKVANLIARILQTKKPKLRYPIGQGSRLLPILKFLTPQRLFTKATRKFLRI